MKSFSASIKRIAALASAAVLSVSLTGCMSWIPRPSAESLPSPTPSAVSTPAATPEPTPEVTETPTPEAKAVPSDVWEALGPEGEEFASSFKASDITSLEFTYYGEGGASLYTTKDPSLIQDVFDAIDAISIDKETDTAASDADDFFRFIKKDGDFGIRFNMHNLQVGSNFYLLKNSDELWKLADVIMSESENNKTDDNPPKTDAPSDTATATSNGLNFSFEYNSSYTALETDSGHVAVFMDPSDDKRNFFGVGRLTGTTAEKYVAERARAIAEEYSLYVTEGSLEPQPLEMYGRKFYTFYTAFKEGALSLGCSEYAEDREDGSIIIYTSLYTDEYINQAAEAIRLAARTIEVGDLPSGGTAPEPTAAPKPSEAPAPTEAPSSKKSESQTAGNFTFTEELLENGDIEVCFDDALIVDMPGSWIGKTMWEADGDWFGFYQTASYEKIKEETGYTGGHLFSVVWYPDTSYENLPSYQYAGAANDGYYVLVFPTDVQAYMDGGEIQDEYFSLYQDLEYVKNSVRMK